MTLSWSQRPTDLYVPIRSCADRARRVCTCFRRALCDYRYSTNVQRMSIKLGHNLTTAPGGRSPRVNIIAPVMRHKGPGLSTWALLSLFVGTRRLYIGLLHLIASGKTLSPHSSNNLLSVVLCTGKVQGLSICASPPCLDFVVCEVVVDFYFIAALLHSER